MSELEIPVAEPVQLTRKQARELTDRIRAGVTNLLPIIKEAFEGRADRAMGYDSWNAYCDAELRGLRVPVSVEERRAAVAELREAGMSIPAIASATGASVGTVHSDLSELKSRGVQEPETVASLDGRRRPASKPAPPEPVDKDAEDESGVEPDLVDTPVGPMTREFAEVLDRLVPDPDPHASWRQAFLKASSQLFAVVRFDPEEIAEKGDDTCFDEYRRTLALVNEHYAKTKSARTANTPDNVTPLRRTS